jgi:hypothetical protein
MITEDMLDELFTFHKWSADQVENGNAIRAAGKEFSRAILRSAPTLPSLMSEEKTKFSVLSAARRQEALEMVQETVMKANSAITFEALALEPIAPEDAHSERIAK